MLSDRTSRVPLEHRSSTARVPLKCRSSTAERRARTARMQPSAAECFCRLPVGSLDVPNGHMNVQRTLRGAALEAPGAALGAAPLSLSDGISLLLECVAARAPALASPAV